RRYDFSASAPPRPTFNMRHHGIQPYSNTSGLQTKDSSGSGAFTSSRGDDSEVTFGAQMEVWW
ncbi:hypothetical protein FK514_27650, partial [Klebsiella pneumoniae]|uniref:hypothetical protein n=1 Tax=Klebsiella pneumoniae TaxID=573 RepID=UPI00210936F7